MRRKQQPDRPGQIGEYWLSRRSNSSMWCRTWFDPRTRQTCRASLGTSDLAAAGIALAQWITNNVATNHAAPADISIGRVFARYHERHAQHRIGADAQRVSLAMILRAVPEGMTVGALTLDARHELVRALQAGGYAAGTIKRALGAAKAAVNWAWNNEELDRPIPSCDCRRVRGASECCRSKRWRACGIPTCPSTRGCSFALAIGTAGRPQSLLQLTRFRCDLNRDDQSEPAWENADEEAAPNPANGELASAMD
jgi:hypothetical protein